MKAHLLFEDRDLPLSVEFSRRGGFKLKGPELPARSAALVQDLELGAVLRAMAGGDALVFDVAKWAMLSSLTGPEEIAYRQEVLFDCIAHPDVARELYSVAATALVRERQIFGPFLTDPPYLLQHALEVLEVLVAQLKQLRRVADDHAASVVSRGLTALFSVLRSELTDEYFGQIDEHLKRMKWKHGVLSSARLGRGNRGADYVLRTPRVAKRNWKERVGLGPRTAYSFQLADRDEAGFRMLSELTGRGVNLVANALTQSTDHVLSFFSLLCVEASFYVGCLNLYDKLAAKDKPVCAPVPLEASGNALSYRGIYDVSLALRLEARLVGNRADADGKSLIMITGANSGGKSTLLRSFGQAQLMMQCGMFVGAEAFRANVAPAIFTHFVREEDKAMRSGKLDEELARMSAIAEELLPCSAVLFNESFGATNEREGSEIARQVVEALLESSVKVFFVTHQYTLANKFYGRNSCAALFLRAQRDADGRRTFKLEEGKPLPTSFGEDLYWRIGGWTGAPAAPAEDSSFASMGDGAGTPRSQDGQGNP
jgi:MutS domain V